MGKAITSSPLFEVRMGEIRRFLHALDAGHIYDQLIEDLEHTIYPNLSAFPLVGNPYLEGPVQSTEALMVVAKLPRDASRSLRKYVHDAFVVLYIVLPNTIHLVSIRHHRESTFNP